MTEENKPLESDVDVDLDFEEIEQETETGGKDVDTTKEFLTKVSSIAGREFKSVEEYEKHYKNLSSFVGKKVEPVVKTEQAPKKSDAMEQILKNQEKIEFFMEKPEAKTYFTEFVKPLADGSGISLQEAWDKVQPLIQSRIEQEKEKETGVNSKNRIKTFDNSEVKKLAEKARMGNSTDQEAFVAKALGL